MSDQTTKKVDYQQSLHFFVTEYIRKPLIVDFHLHYVNSNMPFTIKKGVQDLAWIYCNRNNSSEKDSLGLIVEGESVNLRRLPLTIEMICHVIDVLRAFLEEYPLPYTMHVKYDDKSQEFGFALVEF